MNNISLFKSQCGSECAPFIPVGALLREVLKSNPYPSSLGKWNTGTTASLCIPPLEFYETEDNFHLSLELPGVSKDDVKISYHQGQLTIAGKKSPASFGEKPEKAPEYYAQERHFGDFSRVVEVPSAIKSSDITASFKDGILSILLPKVEEAKPQTIEVKLSN
jgi:HSP20 family protein